jgi:hypothetical protein
MFCDVAGGVNFFFSNRRDEREVDQSSRCKKEFATRPLE